MRGPAGLVAFAGVAMLTMAACQPAQRAAEPQASDAPLFAPTDVRVHPFTSVKDWDGDNRADGVEVLIELQDRFRDPVKSTGVALFELFAYQRDHPDPRGERLAAWRGSLQTLEEQRTHWNRISRTYSFQLAYPAVRTNRAYVLQVWFDTGGRRLMSQVILDAAPEAPERPATTIPVTRPATAPSAAPAR